MAGSHLLTYMIGFFIMGGFGCTWSFVISFCVCVSCVFFFFLFRKFAIPTCMHVLATQRKKWEIKKKTKKKDNILLLIHDYPHLLDPDSDEENETANVENDEDLTLLNETTPARPANKMNVLWYLQTTHGFACISVGLLGMYCILLY